jgi:hypothetical protein
VSVLASALGLTAFGGSITVGYYTDYNTSDTGPVAPITANGFTPVQITTLTGFNLNSINILMIDESANGSPSADFLGDAAAIATWVSNGGVVAINDRNTCQGTCTPIPGGAGISITNDFGTDINVQTSGNLLVNGPFGTITDPNLDGGNYSDHGFATQASLPAGTTSFLNNGTPDDIVAFGYQYGAGYVFYSTVPLDYVLDGSNPPAFASIYAPNMLALVSQFADGDPTNATPEPATMALTGLGLAGVGFFARRRRSS